MMKYPYVHMGYRQSSDERPAVSREHQSLRSTMRGVKQHLVSSSSGVSTVYKRFKRVIIRTHVESFGKHAGMKKYVVQTRGKRQPLQISAPLHHRTTRSLTSALTVASKFLGSRTKKRTIASPAPMHWLKLGGSRKANRSRSGTIHVKAHSARGAHGAMKRVKAHIRKRGR